jgi:hypothetical protein
MIRLRATLSGVTAGLVLAGSLLSAAPLAADSNSAHPTVDPPAFVPATPPAGSSFDQRLALRKQEQNVQLTQDQTQQLQDQCLNSQGLIRKLLVTTTPTIHNRNNVYLKIDGTVWVDIGQLKLANKDTFQLEQERLALAQDMANFKTTGNNYIQTLNDLLAINCQADITGFKALLDTARNFYQLLQNQSSIIYNYTVNTTQPTIQNYVSQLQTKNDATSTENQ